MINPKNTEKRVRIETYEYLSKILSYNPENGHLVWKVLFPGRIAGSVNSDGYIKLALEKLDFKAHRIAWILFYGEPPTRRIDHVNRVKSDNRITNLRECDQYENSHNCNISANNTTGFAGVSKIGKRFRAYISKNRRQINLGVHDTAEEAHVAYTNASKFIYGEFSPTIALKPNLNSAESSSALPFDETYDQKFA